MACRKEPNIIDKENVLTAHIAEAIPTDGDTFEHTNVDERETIPAAPFKGKTLFPFLLTWEEKA